MAVSYPIPPWIAQGADPAAQYAQGLGIGVRIGAERAQQQYAQQQLLRQQAKDEFDRQYQQAKLQFDVDRVMRVQQAQAGFQQAVQSGMDPSQALMQFGPAMGDSASDIIRAQGLAEQRQANDQITQMKLAAEGRTADLRERELGLRERNINLRLAEPERAKLNSIYAEMRGVNAELAKLPAAPSDDEDDEVIANRTALVNRKAQLQKQINRIGKEPSAPVEATVTPQPTAPGSSGGRVKVIAPDGKRGSIPAEQLDEALREGYRQVE